MALAAGERGFLRDKMNRFERRSLRRGWARIASARIKDKGDQGMVGEFARYHDDPVGFCRDVLGVELWSRQAEIAQALVTHEQVAAKTGHKIGKSLMAACLCLWWACTRSESLVIVTAPGHEQVKDIIWKELRKLHEKIRQRVGGTMPLDPNTGLRLANGSVIKGLATDTPERVAGRSGQSVLVIIDEASGYADALYEALETSAAGGDDEMEEAGEARIFAIGNPTRTSGWFFEIFRTANPDWSRHTVSSEETPNVVAANDNGTPFEKPVRGLATASFIRKLRRKYGPNPDTHPIYMVRVKGLYPERSSDSVVALSDVERAMRADHRARVPMPPAPHEVTLGVDVARFGDDDSAITASAGFWASETRSHSGLDGPQLAAEALREALAYVAQGRRVRINVDGVGVGASVLDALVRSELVGTGKAYVVDVQAGAKADDEANYVNLRSELWFCAGTWLAEGGSVPRDDELQRDLLCPTYSLDGKGRIDVMSKKEMKKRLGRSPDKGDSFIMAVYRGRAVEMAYQGVRTSAVDAYESSGSRGGGFRRRGGAL